MSDFPELDDFPSAPPSGAPQADFLARERALLGDEFGGTPESFELPTTAAADLNDGDQFGLGDFSSTANGNSHTLNDHIPSTTVAPVSVTGVNDELSSFQDQYPDISHDITPNQTNGFGGPAPSLYANPASNSGTPLVYATTQVEEESPFIKEWRIKQAEEIQIRDQRSLNTREETIAAAEKAIDDFYHGYNTQKEKNIAKNKEQEASFLQARNDKLGQGTTWERICDLIDLQDSRSKTCGKSNRDLGRFKEILLSLKREGESAPGAAGY